MLYPLVLLALLSSAAASAASDPLFYCTTNEGKKLQVLEDGEYMIYQYGSDLRKPELELRRHRSKVAVKNTLQPGPILTRSFAFANGSYRYAVEIHAIRIPFEHDHEEGGVEVYAGTVELGGPRCVEDLRQRLLVIERLPVIEFPMIN
ncbi:hypothetical protein [Microbulbifer taiwanensis]